MPGAGAGHDGGLGPGVSRANIRCDLPHPCSDNSATCHRFEAEYQCQCSLGDGLLLLSMRCFRAFIDDDRAVIDKLKLYMFLCNLRRHGGHIIGAVRVWFLVSINLHQQITNT